MKNNLVLISFLILIISCKNENKNDDSTNLAVAKNNKIEKQIEQVTDTISDDLYVLFSNFKKDILKQLPVLSNQKADYLYDAYIQKNDLLLDRITIQETAILDEFYSEDKQNKKNTALLKEKIEKHDLILEEIGEGMVRITTKPDFYYKLFSNYVSPDYKSYLAIKSEENKALYAADAGLAISFHTLGERIISWENFMKTYPKSSLFTTVKENYKSYQQDYLLGLDNTPSFNYMQDEERYIYPENLKEFEIFTKKNPTSLTVKLITVFKENFKEENIRDIIVKAQEKL